MDPEPALKTASVKSGPKRDTAIDFIVIERKTRAHFKYELVESARQN